MLAFLNGNIIDEQDAKVSILDRGFLYGDGVFETLRAYGGIIFKLEDHIHRLFQSAEKIHIPGIFSREEIIRSLYSLLKRNNLTHAYLRIMITRGVDEPGLLPQAEISPTMVIITRPFSGYPSSLYEKGLKIVTSHIRHIPPSTLDPTVKSLNFLPHILARIEAQSLGAQEGLLLSQEGYVAEGTGSNIFVVKDKEIFTPPVAVGILNGITRMTLIAIAREAGYIVRESLLSPHDLYEGSECFITSTLYEVMPVTQIDNRPIGHGIPGPISQHLLHLFRKKVQEECRLS